MVKKLVIVESPAKAKKIGSFLDNSYKVVSSVGHIRDLPIPSKLPDKIKQDEGFKKFSVNIAKGFEPYYAVYSGKSKLVSELKKELKDATELYLATDEDREGEAIAWHLKEVLNPKVRVCRMVFNEITKDAIMNALNSTRDIDQNLVDAQEARRILDRLFGFQISPFLWRKFGQGLSAGRVQSVATRILVNREKERMKFTSATFCDLDALFFDESQKDLPIKSKLTACDGSLIATSRDFDNNGNLLDKSKAKNVQIIDSNKADDLVQYCQKAQFKVKDVSKKAYTRKPKAPFTTSSLQQEAGNRLKKSSAQIMRIAQSLYENGYITYMRTDSPALSTEAIKASRDIIVSKFGADQMPQNPNVYSSSSSAQEAHEAIRPAGNQFKDPQTLVNVLSSEELELYNLIYRRTLASQMTAAKGWTTSIQIVDEANKVEFSASGTIIDHKGFLLALNDYEGSSESEDGNLLPNVKKDDAVKIDSVDALSHDTKPPARYTESSLVKKMEELGIGRPSTYASTIQTIIERKYAFKKGSALVPSWLAFGVNRVLEDTLSKYVDYSFTNSMETDLDKIALGKIKRNDVLSDFWFGDNNDNHGLEKDSAQIKELIERRASDDVIPIGKLNQYQVRITQYGAIIEDLKNLDSNNKPKRGYVQVDLPPDELTDAEAKASIDKGVGVENTGRELGVNPDNNRKVIVVNGRYGPYFTEILPDGAVTKGKGAVKAKTGSLLKTMNIDTVTLDDALKVFELPKVLGINPPDGQKITVNNGRFGPYLMKMDSNTKKYDYRSIKKTELEDAESRMFTITLEEAIDEYSHPKIYRRAKKTK